ncbi:MAG: efflux RND transporter periplasmic adaptor subunit [Caulobacteraceae bacterium]|nr:efflux RND transporter periplasmic adaptor subunit [Caulobacter sp.]RYF95081.1 MAG: efflux RND transporter periplasmic adaptor subunit [Caulobacteraceae bacterium]
MQIKQSHLVAAAILGGVVLLFIGSWAFGALFGEKEVAKVEAKPQALMVTTRLVEPELRPGAIVLRGRTEAARTVIVRAETAGPVASVPAAEGSFVRRGAILCRISVDARQASLDQARAALKSRQLQMQASQRLAAQGYRSQTQVLQDQANLDSANASVRQAQVLLDQVNIRAPFSGVFDRREAEVGSYLAPGGACGTMLELDPLVIVADLAESQIGKVRIGETATATLTTGETLSGRIRFVARDADPQTRTYRVEVVVSNPGGRARSGLSADVRIATPAATAHRLPSSALVLGSDGRQGVRHILGAGQVAFTPIEILEQGPDGVWVSGLAGPVQLIVAGQAFVNEGQTVRVRAEGAPAPVAAPAPPANGKAARP